MRSLFYKKNLLNNSGSHSDKAQGLSGVYRRSERGEGFDNLENFPSMLSLMKHSEKFFSRIAELARDVLTGN